MKRLLTILLIFVMCTSLAGCGNGGSTIKGDEPKVTKGDIQEKVKGDNSTASENDQVYLSENNNSLDYEVDAVNHTRFKIPSSIIEGKPDMIDYLIASMTYAFASNTEDTPNEDIADLESVLHNGFKMEYNEAFMIVDAKSDYIVALSTYLNENGTSISDTDKIKDMVGNLLDSDNIVNNETEPDTDYDDTTDSFKVGEIVSEDSTKRIFKCSATNTGLTENSESITVNMEGYLGVVIKDGYISIGFVMYNSDKPELDWALSFVKSIDVDVANPGTALTQEETYANIFGTSDSNTDTQETPAKPDQGSEESLEK